MNSSHQQPPENTILRFVQLLDTPVLGLSRLLFRFSGIIVGIMAIPILLDITMRLTVQRSILGVIEIEEFLLTMVVYGACAHLQAHKNHISIDLLVSRLPKNIQYILEISMGVVGAVLFTLMAWRAAHHGLSTMEEVSFQLQIPIWIFMLYTALGIGLTAAVILLDSVKLMVRHYTAIGIMGNLIALGGALVISGFPWMLIRAGIEIEGLALGGLGMLLLFALIFLRMPISFAMFFVGFEGIWLINENLAGSLSMLGAVPYGEIASWLVVVVPLFILMGELAYYSGMSQEMFDAAYVWFGRMPGGLAISSIAGCAGFAAVSGDSLSTSVTMGSIALPAMKKKKYSDRLATGCIAAGGTLGILIPPSMGFIFYALVTETSIGRLFLAGLIPGVVLASLFIFVILYIAKRNPDMAPPGDSSTLMEKIVAIRGIFSMVILIVVILGGIMGGFFSPTEGGAVGVGGAFIYALVKRRINRDMLLKSVNDTVRISASLLMIIAGVGLLGNFLAATRLPFELSAFVSGLSVNKYIILLTIIFFYMLLGCALNVIPLILITLPAIYPTVIALGFDPIWFGVISVILMEMGQITPPIGMICFAVSSVADDVPIATVFKGIIPFVFAMVVCLVLLIVFPQIALFIPQLAFS